MDRFRPLQIIHVTVQQGFMCMTVTCTWLVHTCSFMEVASACRTHKNDTGNYRVKVRRYMVLLKFTIGIS